MGKLINLIISIILILVGINYYFNFLPIGFIYGLPFMSYIAPAIIVIGILILFFTFRRKKIPLAPERRTLSQAEQTMAQADADYHSGKIDRKTYGRVIRQAHKYA